MLKPAILYKEELLKKFAEELYTQDYTFYMGYSCGTLLPHIEEQENRYQYAIINKANEVIGYFAYDYWPICDTILNFGLYSFDKGNPIVGYDLYNKLKELIERHHRIEWRVVGNNPVKRSYDTFCKKYNGMIAHLHQSTKDTNGNYVDEFIYEIIDGGKINESKN